MSSKRLLDRVSRSFIKSSKVSTSKESYVNDESRNTLSVSSNASLSVRSATTNGSFTSGKTTGSFTSIAEKMSLGLDVLWDGEDAVLE